MLTVRTSKEITPSYDGDIGIDFVEVAERHIAWRARLLSHIHQEADEVWLPSDASSYDRCQLGTWLRGPQRMMWGNSPVFKRLEIAHAEFHYFAGVT